MSQFNEGKHKRDVGGKFSSGGGGSEGKSTKTLESRREAIGDAMTALANGAKESTIPQLRSDIEQYGGTNDVTIVRGNKDNGIVHIAQKHGAHVIPGVLEALADGDVTRFVSSKKTLHLQKDGYEAILSLDESGKKKTWLLTGFDIMEGKNKKASDAGGKVSTRHAATHTGPMCSRPGMGADALLTKSIVKILQKSTHTLVALDASQRRKDENGFLHVACTNISKEAVNPYYGREIPGWKDLGLDPERIYQGYRSGEELAKGAATFNGLPVLMGHHVESAAAPQTEHRVGSLGTEATFVKPYLQNALVATTAEAIRGIESGETVEISSAYAYEPDFTPGEFEGQKYDFIMRHIRGNHVALVEEGRAGPDVLVADSQINHKRGLFMNLKTKLKRFRDALLAMDADPETQKQLEATVQAVLAVQAVQEGAHGNTAAEDTDKTAVVEKILAMFPDLPPEKVDGLKAALTELAGASSTAADNDVNKEQGAQGADEGDPAMDSEELKAAMDKCGLDADDPAAQKAFSEGMKHATKQGEGEESPKPATDSEEAKAMDAALRQMRRAPALATDAAITHMRSLNAAAREVRPLMGDIVDPLAFDSAESIYGKALDLSGVQKGGHPRSAWRGMCTVLIAQRSPGPVPAPALGMDGKTDGPGQHLKNIRLEY